MFTPNVAGLISSANIGPLTLQRYGPPTIDEHGGAVPATPTASQLDPVAVHTFDGRLLEQLPEADRHVEMIQLYTRERLHVADDGVASDRITYRDRSWRVVRSSDHSDNGDVWVSLAALDEVTP